MYLLMELGLILTLKLKLLTALDNAKGEAQDKNKNKPCRRRVFV